MAQFRRVFHDKGSTAEEKIAYLEAALALVRLDTTKSPGAGNHPVSNGRDPAADAELLASLDSVKMSIPPITNRPAVSDAPPDEDIIDALVMPDGM